MKQRIIFISIISLALMLNGCYTVLSKNDKSVEYHEDEYSDESRDTIVVVEPLPVPIIHPYPHLPQEPVMLLPAPEPPAQSIKKLREEKGRPDQGYASTIRNGGERNANKRRRK